MSEMSHPSRVVRDFGEDSSSAENTDIQFRSTCMKQPQTFRSIIGRYADNTSCVGPGYISSSRTWHGKVVWICLFLASWVGTIYMAHANFSQYLSYNTKVGIYMGFSRLKFPMVSICNTNPIRRSQINSAQSAELRDFLYTLDNPPTDAPVSSGTTHAPVDWWGELLNNSYLEDYYYDNYYDDYWFGAESKKDPRSQVREEFKFLYATETSANKANLGHQLENMLISCSFAGLQCSENDFTLSQSNEFGNCFSFNVNAETNLTSRRSGNHHGLVLMLYLENNEYISGLTSGYGARLVIGEPGSMVLPEYNGFYLSAGAETDVGLKLINITRMGRPYADCVSEEMSKNSSGFHSGFKYTRQACQATCLHSMILKQCNCFLLSQLHLYPSSIFENTTIEACEDINKADCVQNLVSSYNYFNNLTCDCPNPCWEQAYDTMMSSRDWPTKGYLTSLENEICKDPNMYDGCQDLRSMEMADKRRNFLKVNVFYRDMNYENVKEEPDYPESQFFSDLGGSAGLFLGLSVLSLFELFHLIMELSEWGMEALFGHEGSPEEDKGQVPDARKEVTFEALDVEKLSGYCEPIRYVNGHRT